MSQLHLAALPHHIFQQAFTIFRCILKYIPLGCYLRFSLQLCKNLVSYSCSNLGLVFYGFAKTFKNVLTCKFVIGLVQTINMITPKRTHCGKRMVKWYVATGVTTLSTLSLLNSHNL